MSRARLDLCGRSVTGDVHFEGTYFTRTQALAGAHFGMREFEDGRWLVTHVDLDLEW